MMFFNSKCSRFRRFFVVSAVLAAGCGDDDDVTSPGTNSADLAVTVSSPEMAVAGADVTFQVTVANEGPDAAAGVALGAQLPAGVTATSISDGGTQSGTVVSWTIGSVSNAQSVSRSMVLTPAGTGDLTVTGTATSTTSDPASTNNDGSAPASSSTTSVTPDADVVVLLASNPPVAVVTGDAVEWTVTVRNDGPSTATEVAPQLVLEPAPGSPAASDGGTTSGDTVTWPPIASLAPGDSLVLTVTGTAPAVGRVQGSASSTATISDSDPSNNDGNSPAARTFTNITFEPVFSLQGEAAGDQFGWLMDIVGDIDGDGAAEFVVGAPTSDAGGTDAGRAYVYSGATGTALHTFTGASGEQLGFAVDGAGDVDNDGVPDVVVGGPAAGNGRAIVFSGIDGSVLHDLSGEAADDFFGQSVSGLGDVNGDGFDDILVTAPGNDAGGPGTGRVYVISGQTGAALATMSSAASGAFFGSAVGGIGDVTGDGISDFAVGAANASGSGRIYVLNGVTADTVFFSIPAPASGTDLGLFWLNSPGDVNGDLIPDVYASDILDNGAGTEAGRAFIFSGADGSTLLTVAGEAPGDQFGMGRGMPDVNGDGFGDLVVAGWLNDEGASGAGKIYVYSGADGVLLRSFVSTTAGDNLGFDVIAIGDVTGDGLADFLVSGGISATTPGRVDLVAGIALP